MDLTRKSKQSNWRMFTELKRFGGAFIAAVLSTVILRLCAVSNTILKFLFNMKFVSWELKNHIRRWWRKHNTAEFGRKITKGTMERMHKVAQVKGQPVCEYYTIPNWMCLTFLRNSQHVMGSYCLNLQVHSQCGWNQREQDFIKRCFTKNDFLFKVNFLNYFIFRFPHSIAHFNYFISFE